MRRSRIIYGTAAVAVTTVLAVALFHAGATDPLWRRAAPVASAAQASRYYQVVPDATPEQIAQWEANAIEYERQDDAADRCRQEAHAEMDRIPEGDTDRYNEAVGRANACDDVVDVALVEDHPLYEVTEGMVIYVGS